MKKIFILLFFPAMIFGQENIERRILKDAQSLGMGGVGVSTMGYSFSPSRNPAALGLMKDHDIAPFFSLGMSMNPEVFDLIDGMNSALSGDFDYNIIDEIVGISTVGINGPLNFGYMGKGFGIWVTSSTEVLFEVRHNPNGFVAQNDIPIKNVIELGEALQTTDLTTKTEAEIKNLIESHLGSGFIDKDPAEIDRIVQEAYDKISGSDADPEKFFTDLLPEARIQNTAEIAVNAGYGYKIPFAGIDDVSGLSLGINTRFVQRFKQSSDYTAIDQLGTYFGNIGGNTYHGSSFSLDFGTSLQIRNFIFGLAVRDAWSTKFHWTPFQGAHTLPPSVIPISLDFGASYRFKFSNKYIQEVGLYLEFEDALSKYSTWLNKLRVGTEIKLFNFLDLRVGMYQEFVSAGVGMGGKWGRIDFAYYRETFFGFLQRDQFYLNFTIGLNNTPKHKAAKMDKQKKRQQAAVSAQQVVDDTLQGL